MPTSFRSRKREQATQTSGSGWFFQCFIGLCRSTNTRKNTLERGVVSSTSFRRNRSAQTEESSRTDKQTTDRQTDTCMTDGQPLNAVYMPERKREGSEEAKVYRVSSQILGLGWRSMVMPGAPDRDNTSSAVRCPRRKTCLLNECTAV